MKQDKWDRVAERYRNEHMLRLIDELRKAPRLGTVEPRFSLGTSSASLQLVLRKSPAYVTVEWRDQPHGFEVWYVIPLERSEQSSGVGEAEVVATIIGYLERARGRS